MAASSLKLDGISTEWLEQVLSRVNVIDLHRNAMLVNKEWEYATRCVLTQLKSLKIVERDLKHETDDDWDLILVSDLTDMQLLLKSLSKMTSVEDLEVDRWLVSDGLDSELVLQNSLSLKSVKLYSDLPLEWVTKYPKLQRLKCQNFNSMAASVCPRLEHLKANGTTTASALMALKPGAVKTLDVTVRLDDGVTASDLMTHLLKMQSMQKLTIRLSDEFEAEEIFRLFYGFLMLKQLILTSHFMASDVSVADDAVRELVRRHPLLEYLELDGSSSFGSQCLVSLSQLEHLKSLCISCIILAGKSPDPIIRFLRESASRTKLQQLYLLFEQEFEDGDMIMDEIRAIEREKGHVFDYVMAHGSSVEVRCFRR